MDFDYGQHTCCGNSFGSEVIKIALLPIKYVFRLFRGESRQKEVEFDTKSMINPEVGMQVRRREDNNLLTTIITLDGKISRRMLWRKMRPC